MRIIAGLDAPTHGIVRVNGKSYRDSRAPMAELGIMLEARAVHTGRSARGHLLALAQTNGVTAKRVSEVIDMVGLAEVAAKRVGGFSLGMGQRLGVAAALLGDPRTVVLDEPVNGLDPEGVLWIRHLLKALADEGRTVFISSHLMSEMALTAQHLIIVGRGRLIADTTVEGFIAQASGNVTRVSSPQAHALSAQLCAANVTVAHLDAETLEVTGLTAREIGIIAWEEHIPVVELTTKRVSLEDAFMELTHDAVDYRSSAGTVPTLASSR
jgi:ABC-2 type transport system ATP-binding protein